MVGSVGSNQYLGSRRLGLGEGSREIRNLVARHLVPVWIRKMAIRYENGQLAEVGLDTDSPISVTWPSDLNTGSVRIVSDDIPMTKGNKAVYEGSHAIGGYIDTVFRNGLQGLIGRRGRVPIELRVHATRPLDNGISSDWVIEWSHKNVGACRTSGLDRRIEIGHEVTRSLCAKGIRNRRLEPENRHTSRRCQDQLRHRAARSWRHGKDALLRGRAPKGRKKTGHEAIEILWRDIDVSCIVLRCNSRIRR